MKGSYPTRAVAVLSGPMSIALMAAATAASTAASAQTLTTLVSFNLSDGANPGVGSLIADASGNLFGATQTGGASRTAARCSRSPRAPPATPAPRRPW